MTTTLSFEAPSDLSVGTVRIKGQQGVLAEWVATPNNRRLERREAPPGFYIAEISPAGVPPQSVIFEVRAGVANDVVTPVFSALSAEGSSPTFLNVTDQKSAIQALSRGQTVMRPEFKVQDGSVRSETALKRARSSGTKKRLTISLACEAGAGTESWRPFPAPTSIELSGGTLNIIVHDCFPAMAGQRARLSLALEHVRVERLLLPLYRGGTIISVAPSHLATSDVALEVAPVDSEKRALLRALAAGTHAEAAAVEERVVPGGDPSHFLEGSRSDPWAAMLSVLLALRFPDIFGRGDPAWGIALLEKAPWAYDAQVIHARMLLTSAAKDPAARSSAASDAVAALANASSLGAPYYSYSNQLIGEMLAALSAADAIDGPTAEKAKSLLARWQRNLPLQAGAAGTFTWLRRDQRMLAEGMLAPDRRTTGSLGSRHGKILFRGRVELGRIALDTNRRVSPKASAGGSSDPVAVTEYGEPLPAPPGQVPALGRPPGRPDDPNKGRFGGETAAGGFSLLAKFESTRSPNWVPLTLIVEASDLERVEPGEAVYFALHPSFDSPWIKASFRGRRAAVSLKAWGGFTVGAWLPDRQIELELDLSELPHAPPIIRDL
jgi:hypothetical protein